MVNYRDQLHEIELGARVDAQSTNPEVARFGKVLLRLIDSARRVPALEAQHVEMIRAIVATRSYVRECHSRGSPVDGVQVLELLAVHSIGVTNDEGYES